MDRPVLFVEAPELSDEAATNVLDFLHELVMVFDAHYYPQLKRYKPPSSCPPDIEPINLSEHEDPPF